MRIYRIVLAVCGFTARPWHGVCSISADVISLPGENNMLTLYIAVAGALLAGIIAISRARAQRRWKTIVDAYADREIGRLRSGGL
jgi:hypothetical protein